MVPPLVVVAMRDIDELLKQEPPVKAELTEEEYTRMAYQAELEEMRDFTPMADRRRWPKPIRPQWKN